jgi:hypothetical protein
MKAATKKKVATAKKAPAKPALGATLSVQQLESLCAELQKLREYPPLTRRQNGKYEGDILGFVKGLRLSARVIYFLREWLSDTHFEVNWGHVLNEEQRSCSPECDIIIHSKGHVRKWNGDGGTDPVMNFRFVRAGDVRAVVSCKSQLDSIDADYPKQLKQFGIRKVFLFAECCREDRITALRAKAKGAGYSGLWCLYFTQKGPDNSMFSRDETMYVDFGKVVCKAVKK